MDASLMVTLYMRNLKNGSVNNGWLSVFIAVEKQLFYPCYMDA